MSKYKDLIQDFENKNYEKIINNSKTLLKDKPNDLYLNIIIAKSFFKLRDFQTALRILSKLTQLYPNKFEPYYEIGNILRDLKNYDPSIKTYHLAYKINKKNFSLLNNIGSVYQLYNKPYLALKYYFKALSLERNNALLSFNIGSIYRELNKIELSREYLALAKLQDPTNFEIHRNYSIVNKYKSKEDVHLIEMLNLEKKFSNSNEIFLLYFALAKAFEDIQNFDLAASYIKKANLQKNNNINFDFQVVNKQFENIKTIFKELRTRAIEGNKEFKSIFILGLPRSGTTLLEQIIGAHHKVYPAGEISYFSKYFNLHTKIAKFKSCEEILQNIDHDTFLKIGNDYITQLNKIDKNLIITDKLPHNFILTGFINLALPNCKIIHCKRNLNSSLFSMYKNYFPMTGLDFTYDISNLKKYGNIYMDLMNFWNDQHLNNFYEISYEDLVDDLDTNAKKIISFCNLEWDSNCLKFYENKNPVSTVSSIQVRQKVYNSSVDSWKQYQSFFPELFT